LPDAPDRTAHPDGLLAAAGVCELVEVQSRCRVQVGDSLTIGRHPTNGLCLDEPLVSSFHAVIERDGEGWSARDLGSLNGTSLNGRRLGGRALLREGDVLRFARGRAWCVERLVAGPRGEARHGLERTQGVQGSLPPDLQIEIATLRPAEGQVTARWGEDMRQQNLCGTLFLLLDRLGQEPGRWITDADLRRSLWGRRWESLSRSALHTPIYTLRRIFESWGLLGAIIEKDDGATRLTLGPDQVVRTGRIEGVSPDEGPDEQA
jgi:hypothetical protein